MVDTTIQNDILDSSERVFGIIYVMTNATTGMKYVGQTVSHRKNKGKYRPFGAIGRFNDHVSEAINNTKRKQCSYLNNAIRKHGKDTFTLEILETCACSDLNTREQHYIQQFQTMYPQGYNLTKGGKTCYTSSFASGDLQMPKKHGGCVARSVETRQKMSARAKQLATPEFCNQRAQHAARQHYDNKLARFKDCIIDKENLDSYIHKKGNRIIVRVGEQSASFYSKTESLEESIQRAKQFLFSLCDATLSNCGKPVKPE